MSDESTETLERYSRQVVLPDIGLEGQKRLRDASVLVLGVGALGTVLASNLVRAGIGYVRLVDRDFIELHNLQRQVLFDEEDVAANLPKAVAAARKLRRINSDVTIEPVVADVTHRNAEAIVQGCDLILDGSDNFEVRMLINELSVKHSIPWIYGAVMATYGVTMPFLPGEGPCFQCLLPSLPAPGATPTCETGGILGTVPQVIAAMQVTEALKLLTGHPERLCRELRYIDLWTGETLSIDVEASSQHPCPVHELHRYDYLDGKRGSVSTVLCGRSAVQIHPKTARAPDFEALADRLSSFGEVEHNAYLLRFNLPAHELVLFPTGRAIVRGTDDPAAARALYARYIGG
ncbi:MAG: ThiF family adenylyltransferase [Anaerolineae bacterium]